MSILVTCVLILGLVILVSLLGARLAPVGGLVALPGAHRQHTEPTPLAGGIGIMAGIALAYYLHSAELPKLMFPLLLIFITGVLDDRFKLPSSFRFAVQALALWLMVRDSGVQLLSLGEIWPGREVLLNSWSLPVTIFAGIGVINAINMSDGLDGLAGAVTLIVLLPLAVMTAGDDILILAVMAAVSGFLCLNLRLLRRRAVLFLGDAGSTLLGMLLAFLLIKYTQQTSAVMAPVTALWLMALPLIDAVAVLLVRPLRGNSPFAADTIHYHHLLRARGLSVNQTLSSIVVVQIALIALGLVMMRWAVAEYLQLALFLILFFSYFVYLLRFTSSKQPSGQV